MFFKRARVLPRNAHLLDFFSPSGDLVPACPRLSADLAAGGGPGSDESGTRGGARAGGSWLHVETSGNKGSRAEKI